MTRVKRSRKSGTLRRDDRRSTSMATGHAMLGIALAPVTGEIVADLVSGERPRYDVSPLTPARFRRRTRRDRS